MRNVQVVKAGLYRKIIIYVCYYLGLIRILRFINRKKILILMIHGVSSKHMNGEWEPLRKTLDSDILDKTLNQLKKHYNFISMQEAADMLSGKLPLKKNCIVITLDDGYRNNIEIAYPIFKKYDIPIIIYLSTGHIENRKAFWFDRLDYAIQKLPKGRYELEMGGRKAEIICNSRHEKKVTFWHFRRFVKCKSASDDELTDFINQTCDKFEKITKQSIYDVFENDPWVSVLDWDTIKKYSKMAGCEFGSHTVNHSRLAKVDENTAMEQLSRSKKMVEEKTNKKCKHFAYPNGSYNSRVANMARMSGYQTSLTTENGMNGRGDDLMTLKRFPFPGYDDIKESFFILSGLSMLFSKIKKEIGSYAFVLFLAKGE
jgi:peptidoglycan/xylan/chitin deacetylase (PgdA/CDA1 family)